MQVFNAKSAHVPVQSYAQLDAIIDRLPCFTREGVTEVICPTELFNDGEWQTLKKILPECDPEQLQEFQYVSFWK